MFLAVDYFPNLSHVNIQSVKTRTVNNHATRPVHNDIHMELESEKKVTSLTKQEAQGPWRSA